MTNAIIEKLSYDELQGFLTPYHQRLHTAESFPPLNPNKAMHIAAKSLGLKNAHVMKAQMDAANTQNGHNNTQNGYGGTQNGYSNAQGWSDLREDDAVQFARLVAEFGMAADSENVSLKDVSESMDLDLPEIFTLFARAESAFESIKTGHNPFSQPESKTESVIVLVFNEKEDSTYGSPIHTDIKVVKNWEKAKELIGNCVHSKGIERADADRVEELLEFSKLSLPDEDDQTDLDMEDADEVLNWLIKNNDVYDLALYLNYLDYDLTTVSMEEKFL